MVPSLFRVIGGKTRTRDLFKIRKHEKKSLRCRTVLYILILFCASRFEYIVLVEAISVYPQQQQQQNQRLFANIGSTSVHYVTDDSSFVVGTKKGGIYYYSRNQERNNAIGNDANCNRADGDDNNDNCGWSEILSIDYKTKYPIYSIAVSSQNRTKSSAAAAEVEKFIFCGSGDRWISVWKVTNDNSIGTPRSFKFVQKLGPHTGWVKDLIFDDKSRLLHSIGCNCIESWDCSRMYDGGDRDDDTPSLIHHVAKRTIENSPTMGTTLSSDLLCLCLITSAADSDKELSQLVVSGGVDGRIHLWISDPTFKRADGSVNLDGRVPLHTASAHDGRVNAIVYSSAVNAIFTIGNDGTLCVFRVSSDNGFELISNLKIKGDSEEAPTRLTAASITRELQEQRKFCLALGSSNGDLFFVTTEITPDGGIVCLLKDDCVTVDGKSMIYSLACEEESDTAVSSRLWVGHASGLVTLDGLE